jgi:hypothetical protein
MRAGISLGEDPDAAKTGSIMSVVARSVSEGDLEGVELRTGRCLGYSAHEGIFFQGNLFAPDDPAPGRDEGDWEVVWVGLCDEEVSRGRGK